MSSPIISCQELTKSFGVDPLFEEITFTINEGERLVMIGPNGAGKSTLLKMMASLEEPDSGRISIRRGAKIEFVAQHDIFPDGVTVRQFLEAAASTSVLDAKRQLSYGLSLLGSARGEELIEKLSGGQKKRISIVRALMKEPDVLLLDEPTNHLDIAGVLWLEEILKNGSCASVSISHDRMFIETVAKRVIEVNRRFPKGFFEVQGAYDVFLELRANFVEQQASYRDSLQNKVRREVEWLRRGAKGRTTKQKGRIKEAGNLIEELGSFRPEAAKAGITFVDSERETKELIKVEKISQNFGGRELFTNVSFVLTPGMRLGLVGPNGCGKTTFIRTLLGELAPTKGKVVQSRFLKVAVFDQFRIGLDKNISLKRAICPEGDGIVWNGRPMHIYTWAKRFLFRPEQLEQQVSALSGGEQARALLARLMLEPVDVLILDEPTNDLDIPTLEVLEEALLEFSGALILVTHDRYLLERVATTVFGFMQSGPESAVGETSSAAQAKFFADYYQWESAWEEQRIATKQESRSYAAPVETSGQGAGQKKKGSRLSYLEQREWDGIEKSILKAEEVVSAIHTELADPVNSSDGAKLADACERLSDAQAEVDRLYQRWEDLGAKLK